MSKKLFGMIQEWLAINEQKKQIEATQRSLGADIIAEIQKIGEEVDGKRRVVFGDIKATAVPVQRLTIHDHALQEGFPELYERSLKPNTTALKKAAEVLGVPISTLEGANAVTVKQTHRLDIRGKAL